ncbi:hypothetical protein OG909_30415 [Streptomyces sp. NBC_01754]|uniref:hypothetical protein n=1 Tax=Streptomyces sp. NBC_01754 TaxID=2975930 RepID=UPI002DDBDDD8|nr:hypothetical protein [Streptomyces sp. NBC_01754]WSC96268.1 hypothetical protein OG909_30415 [Streptomyces sp. NBC_01754]
MSSKPNRPEGEDTRGRTVPPYEGRRTSAGVEGKERSRKEGARTGGATGPVEDDEVKASDPARTERGAAASPADEKPAHRSRSSEERSRDGGGDDRTGPAHQPGTRRAEDQS